MAIAKGWSGWVGLAWVGLWAGMLAGLAPAYGQGRLEAHYTARLAGIPIGTGVWIVEIADEQYTAAATGATTGLLRTFAGGQGSGAARGRVKSGQLFPGSYAATISSDKKTDEVRIALLNGNVKDFSIEPEPPANPDRIPLTEATKRGVADPMTASLVRVPGADDPVGPAGCSSGVAVFDGRMRYDLQLQYKRMETVKAEKGYQGLAVVCAVQFTPVAGHVPGRYAIKYLTAQRNMEVWFAPIAGTRVLAPFKIVLPTPLGMATLEARQFVTAMQPRATPTSAKNP